MLKRTIRTGCAIALLAAAGWTQTIGPAEAPVDAKPAADETVVKVGDAVLKGWQVEVMLKNRAGNDLAGAANFWTEIQIKAAEARRRGLDQTPEGRFILDLYRDYFLTNLLNATLAEEAPKAGETEARADYDANPEKYRQPFLASIERISLQERNLAQAALADLKKPDADFNALYNQYNKGPEDRLRGRLNNTPYDRLLSIVGEQAAEAVKAARPDDVIGPLLGLRGFEVIRVKSVRPERMPAFDELKDQIIAQLNQKSQAEYPEQVVETLKKAAVVEESPRLIRLREAVNASQDQSQPAPGQ